MRLPAGFARAPAEYPDEGLLPHCVREVWQFATAVPHTWVDISLPPRAEDTARLAHAGQTADQVDLRAAWRQRVRRIGDPVSLGLAEQRDVRNEERRLDGAYLSGIVRPA